MKKYSVILADPPWQYKVYSKKGLGRSAESHYPTMNIEDIKALPVADIAEKDCALFLWVTFPCLLEGFEVIRAWGFTYKTVAFVWVKQNKKSDSLFWGMGYWTRSNVELCILATKGSPKRVDAGVHQVVVSHIEEHSRKPGEVHERIRRLMGDVQRLSCLPAEKRKALTCGEMKWIQTLNLKEETDYAVSDSREAQRGTADCQCHRGRGEKRRIHGGKRLYRFVVRGASGGISTAGCLF